MKKKGFTWQAGISLILFASIIITLLLPAITISGSKYIDMAVDVNEYAKEQDEKAAKKAGTNKIVKKYEDEEGKDYKKKEKEFDKKIEKEDDDTITGFALGQWALTVKNKLKFPGITFKKGKEIKKSDVQTIFKIMGVLIYLPAIMAVFSLIWTAATRKYYGIFLCITGALSTTGYLFILFAVPGLIWDKISSYVQSFTLINKETLRIDGVGKYTIKQMVSEFGGTWFYINIILGLLLICFGVLCMTALKQQEEVINEENEWDFKIDEEKLYGKPSNTTVQPGDITEPDVPTIPLIVSKKGILRGIDGQYAGFDMEFDAGEEIILGRDAKICKLVFDYPKISRKHCGILYDADAETYKVKNYSLNGTKLANGKEVPKGSHTIVKPGTVLYLANGHEAIYLG